MTEKSLFISSCSRRDLARRRAGRLSVLGLAPWATSVTPPALLVIAAGLAAFIAGRGGI
jgi:hypothetical protein